MNQHNPPCNRWVIGKAVLPQHIVLEIKRDALRVPHTGVSLGAQDHSIAEESAAAPAPVAIQVNTHDLPFRSSFDILDLEVNPYRPVEQLAISDGIPRQVVEGGVPTVEICDHGCNDNSDGRHACYGQSRVHQSCLLLIQGEAGRLPQTAAPHTLILTVGIDIDDYRQSEVDTRALAQVEEA